MFTFAWLLFLHLGVDTPFKMMINAFLWSIDLFQMDPLDKNCCEFKNLLQIVSDRL